MKKALVLFIVTMVLLNMKLWAQEMKSIRVSGHFEQVTLVDFFRQLETQCKCIFLYDNKQLDSITVTLTVQNESLEDVIEKALKNTELQFSFDHQNKVYISKGIKVITSLPDGFFSQQASMIGEVDKDSLVDYGLEHKKARSLTSENKLYEIGAKTNTPKGGAILTGFIRNAKTGEALVNTSVFINNEHYTLSDAYGFYSLTVPSGQHTINILALGMKDTRLKVAVYSDGKLDIDLPEQVTTLKEVIVSSRKTINVNRVQMGVEKLNIESIKRMPSLFGESDLLRVITSLPGIKTVGEASTGFNVRGGSADQNLILFNDATIFNPSHFFGMFSAFNPEVVKEVELYKGSIPARFGGRLASVLDISSRDGNNKNFMGSAGIGFITTRVNVEGPIIKDRTSFIFGGRTTYANWLLGLLPKEYNKSRASFQDVNLGITHRFDSTNNIYFSGYLSNDRFALNSDTTYGYSNRNFTLKWKKRFNSRLSSVFIAGVDEYEFRVISDSNVINAFKLNFDIRQFHVKADFVYYKNQQHSFDFGLSAQMYNLNPGTFKPYSNESLVLANVVDAEQGLENGIYFSHRYTPNNKLSILTGVRYSLYNYVGKQDVNYYTPGRPHTEANLIETKSFEKGKFINNYKAPEVRFSARLAFTPSFSIKAGYNTQRQYLHVLSNTTAIAPTDIWKLSDPNIKPQMGDQVSLGVYKNLKSNTIETSVEVYYKRINNYLDYKPGASLILNHDIEREVINTDGKAYGVEVLLKKPGGKLNGWISYTYSKILLQSNDPDLGVLVNNGDFYPANYDKPHDVTFTGNFRVNHRFSFSLNSTYSTGRPITFPIGRYFYAGSQRVLYSDRNANRIPDYYRTDFSMNIDGNHKVNQKTHNSWTIGVYNMLGRRNPYSVYFISEGSRVKSYKLSIFGSAIPFINFNIRF